MDKKTLETLAERYQKRADRAFENYQETGIKRYDTERNNMEDLADALRMAANAADEHNAYVGDAWIVCRPCDHRPEHRVCSG